MSVSGITSNAGIPQGWQNVFQQQRQDFNQLAQALQSNDLAGAQKAYADLMSLRPNNSASATNSNSTTNPIANDFTALGQALASGNLTQAQNDFTQLQNDLQSAAQNPGGAQGAAGTHRGHHHHHHHSVSSSQDSSSTDSTNGTTGGSNNSDTSGSVNLTA